MEAFLNDKALTSINIPAGLTTIGESAIANSAVSTITLDPANTAFVMDNGVLYTADKSLLQMSPMTGVTTHVVDENCKGIVGGAFWGSKLQNKVFISPGEDEFPGDSYEELTKSADQAASESGSEEAAGDATQNTEAE